MPSTLPFFSDGLKLFLLCGVHQTGEEEEVNAKLSHISVMV
jgi:hypothetical protein